MTSLVLASMAFAAIHLLVSGTPLRDAIVARLGERPFQGLFSLASAVLLGWLIWAFARARQPQVTEWLEWRWLAVVLVFLAFALVVLGLMTRGPTVVGGEQLLDREDAVRGIHRVTRHPFLWGVALWAAVHAVFNPGPVNGIFFGTFLLVAVAGTFSLDAKRARRYGDKWARYAKQTSNLPFAAIVQGRNKLVLSEFGLAAPAITLAVFAAFALLHARFFGVPPF